MGNSLTKISINNAEIQRPVSVSVKTAKTGENSLPKDAANTDIIDISKALKQNKSNRETNPDFSEIKVNTFPQDPYADKNKTEIEKIEREKIGSELKGKRLYIDEESIPKAIADPDGNYFYSPATPQFDQVNSFFIAQKTLDMIEYNVGHKINWAFEGQRLGISPHAGEGQNAYYARLTRSVNYFSFYSADLSKTVHTSQSADVVSHELGHAILDGLRPGFLFSWDKETASFHEAFADCSAILYALSFDTNINAVIKETGGNIDVGNRLSMLAEEFAVGSRSNNSDPTDDNNTFLRSALNDFKYTDLSNLPKNGHQDILTSEPHSYSRIFLGGFYDCLKNIYNKNLNSKKIFPDNRTAEKTNFLCSGEEENKRKAFDALTRTRDILGPVFGKALDLTPPSSTSYKQVALCMIKADEILNNGENRNEIAQAFLEKGILTNDDLEKFEESKMPPLTIEPTVSSEKDAFDFLKKNKSIINANPEEFCRAEIIKDRYGNTIIIYTIEKEYVITTKQLRAPNYDHLYADFTGGLTLAFDKEGKLKSMFSDKISKEKVDQAIKEMITANNDNLIRNNSISGSRDIFRTKDAPYRAEIYQDKSGKMKIRRLPVIS